MIGERCNVAGSSIYKKAIVDGDYDKAVSIALSQVGLPVWAPLKLLANACT
jgi:cobalamin-dependent methionine synthase I